MFIGPLDRNVIAALGKAYNKLDLVVDVGRLLRIGKIGTIGARCKQQRAGVLFEKERWLAVRVMAHFTGMFCIVPADAEDTVGRERLI